MPVELRKTGAQRLRLANPNKVCVDYGGNDMKPRVPLQIMVLTLPIVCSLVIAPRAAHARPGTVQVYAVSVKFY
jgi:hypothetical protein